MTHYVSTNELLTHLTVCRSTLYGSLRHQEGFPQPHKIGKRRLLWDLGAILAWVAAR